MSLYIVPMTSRSPGELHSQSHSRLVTNFVRLTIATTNYAFKVTMNCTHHELADQNKNGDTEHTEHLFIRVFGHDSSLLSDREKEVYFLKKTASRGLGPGIFATFINGYITEFLKGKVLGVEDLRDPFFAARIARTFGRLHQVPKPRFWDWHNIADETLGPQEGFLVLMEDPEVEKERGQPKGIWHTLAKWIAAAESLGHSGEEWDRVKKEVRFVMKEIFKDRQGYEDEEYVLCHNDLNHGNTFYDSNTDRVYFVDYEVSNQEETRKS